MLAFMGLPGGAEWLIILIVALLLFGSRLPSVMRSLGKSFSEFKGGLREGEDDTDSTGEGGKDQDAGGGSSYPAG